MKVFLLGLFGLPFVLSSCEDNANFSWTGGSGTMDCKKLSARAASNIKSICKNTYTYNNASIRVRTKCRKTCGNCDVGCVENCQDNSEFRWEENGTKVSCSWLEGDTKRNDNCERTVTGVGAYAESCVLEEKCPKTCKNCCGM